MGDKEVFYGKEFTVVGILDPTGIGLDDGGFVTLNSIYQMLKTKESNETKRLAVNEGEISALMVSVKPGYARADVAVAIESQVPGVAAVTSKELMSSSVAKQLDSIKPGLLFIGAGFWVIAVLMIGAIFSMAVNERRRELGLLQAMGATRAFIFRLVMLEAVELTAIGGVLGIAVGGLAVLLFKGRIESSMKIAYLWPSAGFTIGFSLLLLAAAVVTGVIAAVYPAVIASRLEPYQAIRTGE